MLEVSSPTHRSTPDERPSRSLRSGVRGWATSRAGQVMGAGAALILAQLGLRGWAVLGSWFQFDDVVFISRLNGHPWTWDLVGHGYAGHFMPAGLSLTWLYVHLDPLGFLPYAFTLLALQAIASVGFLLLLRSLFGARLGILPPLAIYLFTPITLNAFIWWAAGINQLALQVALGWGLLAHLRYLRTRRLRWVFVTVATIAVCLTFYEKVVLVYGAIAIITVAYFTSGSVIERAKQLWSRYRAAIAIHVVVVAAYMTAYAVFALEVPDSSTTGRPSYLDLVGNMVGKAWLPAMFGGPLNYRVLSGPFQLVDPAQSVCLGLVLLAILLVVHIDRTFERSRRAWLLPLFFLVTDIVLVGAARASVIGAVIGLEFRYISELGLVTPLALALSCMAVRGADQSAGPRPSGAPSPFFGNREAVALATVGVCLLSCVSSVQFANHWRSSHESRDYFANADRTLGTKADPTPLINVSVPQYLMWGFDYPRNTNKYVLAMYGDRMTFPDHAVDQMHIIDDSGIVRDVGIAAVASTVGPEEGCVDRVTPSHPVTLHLTGKVDGTDWWARLPYGAEQSSTVTISAGDTEQTVTLDPGLRNFFFSADGTFDTVTITESSGSGVCIGNLKFGFPQPIEPQTSQPDAAGGQQ